MASEITSTLIRRFVEAKPIPDSVAIDKFFQDRAGMHFLPWFNANLAGKGPWAKVTSIVDTPQNRLRFHQFWNQSDPIFAGDMSPIQFICLMSIFCNECRGDFQPTTERMGVAGHPGMAYLFDLDQEPKHFAFVYRSPVVIVSVPVTFELKDLELP